jgi:hypothetical protein
MNIQSPALIRETFPVGPLQCNCGGLFTTGTGAEA